VAGQSTTFDRLLGALREHISSLLEKSVEDNSTAAKRLPQVLATLERQLQNSSPKQQQILQNLSDDLRRAMSDPADLQQQLEQFSKKLEDHGTKNSKDFSGKLQQTAIRLEQMASTQETLSQLNPVMQALGEPAMILFPFLVSGLMKHSQVTIDPNSKRDRSKKGRDGEPYQRIQVTVPLPKLGPVAVDIAHRDKEILASFHVRDAEVKAFLQEQLELLASQLRQHGFEHAELVARVGSTDSSTPAWASAAETRTSFLA